jgi:quercetin dioxygenase-like cupin family protein
MGHKSHKDEAGDMSSVGTTRTAVVRRAGEGERCWFFGGGVWTWKVSETESGGELSVVEVTMDGGKVTPLHTHPIAESLWVLEGELRYHVDGEDVALGRDDYILVPAGVPHAFMVVSEEARILGIQPSTACEAFYRGASEPLEASARETDFGRIAESGRLNGGIEILGPPPF